MSSETMRGIEGSWYEYSTAAAVAALVRKSDALGDFDVTTSDVTQAGPNHLEVDKPMQGPQEYAFMAATNKHLREHVATISATGIPLQRLGIDKFVDRI